MDLARIVAMEALPGARVRLRFADGAEGVAELAPLVAQGGVFATLDGGTLTVAEGGRAVAWRDPDGEEADMDADTLRRMIGSARVAA